MGIRKLKVREFRAMPTWSWIANSLLWAISICLAGFSIRFLIKGVRDLGRAKWSEYADQYEEMLNSHKEHGIAYKKMIDEYDNMISEVKKLLNNKEPAPQFPNLIKHLGNLQAGLEDVTKGHIEIQEGQIDILKQLTELAKKGGIRGFSTLGQIDATKNIAIAAVLMAFSSIGFSISGAILSVVG